MGSWWSKEGVFSCVHPDPPSEPVGKLALLEKKLAALELRLDTTDEANQRLYQKWGTVENRFHQLEGLHQGDIRALQIRCQTIEKHVEMLSPMSYDRCDDIIVIEEE